MLLLLPRIHGHTFRRSDAEHRERCRRKKSLMHSGKSTWQWKIEHMKMYFCISYCDVLVYQSENMNFWCDIWRLDLDWTFYFELWLNSECWRGNKKGSFRVFGAVDVQSDSLRFFRRKSLGASLKLCSSKRFQHEADVEDTNTVCSFFVTHAFAKCSEVF